MATDAAKKPSTGRRLLWFIAIYGLSVIGLAAVVYGLKALFGGLTG